jgi:primosomal protein N'
MFVEVIPRTHSIWFRPLTYSVGGVFEWEISIGCLVQIPVGKKDDIGLVTKIFEEAPSFWWVIRPISWIISGNEILAPYQIELIQNIAHHSMIPIYKVLSIFLSQAVIKRLEKQWFPILQEKNGIKQNGRFTIKIAKDTIIDSIKIAKNIESKTVIICPDDFMLYKLEKELSETYPDALFLPGEASDTKKARLWIEISQGKYLIIFWTRKVLYYNLSAFNQILYLEDAFCSEYYHYPTKIRYHDILSLLEEQSYFDITIMTSVPTLETLHRFHDSIIAYI